MKSTLPTARANARRSRSAKPAVIAPPPASSRATTNGRNNTKRTRRAAGVPLHQFKQFVGIVGYDGARAAFNRIDEGCDARRPSCASCGHSLSGISLRVSRGQRANINFHLQMNANQELKNIGVENKRLMPLVLYRQLKWRL